MKTNCGMMKRLTKLGLFLMLGVSMSACSTSWREEALLHDGQKIIVTRTVERGGRHEIGQRPPIGDQSLSFVLPSIDHRIKWEDNYSEDLGSSNFNPMLVEVFGDAAYVLAAPAGCLAYNKWGRPNPPYVVFKYEGKEWKRILLQELPIEIKLPNLIISSPDSEAKKIPQSPISAETIKELNTGFGQPQYRTILREPLKNAGGGCMEEIRTGDGWMSIDWFSSQKSFEACLKVCERENVNAQNCPCAKLFKGK